MKRLALTATLLLFVVLCVSLSFWGLKFFKPNSRGVALPEEQQALEPGAGQWGTLFAQMQTEAAPSGYELKGVILARRAADSMAIVALTGKPAQALRIGQKINPVSELREVHADHVMMAESGVLRRVDLPRNGILQLTSAAAPQNAPVAPPAFPPRNHEEAAPGPNNPAGAAAQPARPMATPGLPLASLPAVMPTGAQ